MTRKDFRRDYKRYQQVKEVINNVDARDLNQGGLPKTSLLLQVLASMNCSVAHNQVSCDVAYQRSESGAITERGT